MFARVRQWAVRHKLLVDAIAVTPFLILALATVPLYTGRPENVPVGVCVALTLGLMVPLTLRRKYPLAIFAAIASLAFVQWLVDVEPMPADLAVLAGMFTVAAHRRFAWAVAALVTSEVGLALVVGRWSPTWDVLPPQAVFVGALWIAGLYTNTRRSYLAGLEERAERLERERDALAQAAAAEERERIAREMHDVVAHNVSVMVVQADGASYVIDNSPDNAKRALEAISRTGREALIEMRRLLGVLRGTGGAGDGSDAPGSGHGADGFTPQPGLEQLTDLVGQVRSAGLAVDLSVEGSLRSLDHGAGLAAYRIIQEALTNTLKHAGPAARAWVRVSYGDDAVEMRIDDDGRGLGARAVDGTGHGLVGMRERAAMLGGRLDTGPRPDGGYRVVATLPINGEVG